MKIADAFVLITKDDSPLRRGLASTKKDIEGWTSSVGGIIKQALGFSLGQAFTAGVQGILGSLRQLSKGLIGGNADFEQYQTRFSVLLGSMDEAKKRIAELAEFGANTPFDLPGVVEADTIIQGFGLHSEEAAARFGFSGEQIRRIAGDVASGAGASFQEIALNIGKFSSGATGEAIMRFQEMGIVTRDQLRQMGIAFSKSGELVSPLPEALNAVLTIMQQKYGGMMQAQSSTFSGMLSNLRDWVGNAQRFLGLPTFEMVKGQLKDLLSFLNSGTVSNALTGVRDLFAALATGVIGSVRGLSGGVIGAFEGMFGDTDQAMQGFANNAFGWGENIAISFAEGIYAAAAAVIEALSYLGALITYWLIPGSPPKLLPNLDAWGQGAANAWLEGWTQADMSAFDTLAGMMERAINSLGLDDAEAVGSLIHVRQWLRQAINEIDQMGNVSAATLEHITSSAGNLAGPIGEYIRNLEEVTRRTKEVEQAQERVNQVNEKYDSILQEQNARLTAIREKEQAFSNEKERARLLEILASATAGEREKEQARLALERLDIEEDIAKTEKAKNKELGEAEKQLKDAKDGLDMAKERLDLSQSYIDQLIEENELLQRQKELLEDIGGGGGSGGAGKKAGGGGMPKVPTPGAPGAGGSIFDRLREFLDGGGEDDITSRIQNLMGRIQDIFKPLQEKGENLGRIWEKLGRAFKQFVVDPINDFMGSNQGALLVDILEGIGLAAGGAMLIGGLVRLGGTLLSLVSPVTILIVLLGVLYGLLTNEEVQRRLNIIPEQVNLLYQQVVEQVGEWLGGWSQKNQEFLGSIDGWLAQLFMIWVLMLVNLFATTGRILGSIKDKWLTVWNEIKTAVTTIWESIKTEGQAWIDEVKRNVTEKVEELRTEWGTKWEQIKKKALELLQALIDALPDKLTTLAGNIISSINTLISDLIGKVGEWEGIGKSFIQGIIDGASSLAGSLVSAVVGMITDAVAAGADALISHSPSQLTHNVLGKPMGEGVIGGWEASMKNAQSQMAQSLLNAIPTPGMVGAGGYGDIHETYNFYGERDTGSTMQDIRDANERRRFSQGFLRR